VGLLGVRVSFGIIDIFGYPKKSPDNKEDYRMMMLTSTSNRASAER
jgi:hypothetical protein